jgi:outer membrane protein OmpA-like peptidoglycan-associated protein
MRGAVITPTSLAGRLLLLLFCCLSTSVPQQSVAQDKRGELFKRFGMRVDGGAAFFLSPDQIGWLGFNRPGFFGHLAFGMLLLPYLTAEVGGTMGVFLSDPKLALVQEATAPGGLLAPWLGVRLHAPSRKFAPFVALNAGPGFTGDLIRPLLQASVGADLGVGRGASLGPVVGFSQVFQHDHPGASSDARFLWVGLSFAYRALAEEPPATTRTVHTHSVERVVEREAVYVPTPGPPVDDNELSELLDRALPAPSGRVELLAPVLFAFDSDALEAHGVAMLHEVASTLRRRTDIELLAIQGYADTRGTEPYNRVLGRRRAERIKAWLIAHGIAAERLIVSDGPNEVVEAGENEPDHQQNRRVRFRVLRMAESP